MSTFEILETSGPVVPKVRKLRSKQKGNKKDKKITAERRAMAITLKANNPNYTVQEIARVLWVSMCAINKDLSHFDAVLAKVPSVENIIEKNNLLVSVADSELARRIMSGEGPVVRTSDLVSLRDSAFKQNQLLNGRATELIGISEIVKHIQDSWMALEAVDLDAPNLNI